MIENRRVRDKLKKLTDPNSKEFDNEVYQILQTDAHLITEGARSRNQPTETKEFYWGLAVDLLYFRIMQQRSRSGSDRKERLGEYISQTFPNESRAVSPPQNLKQIVEKYFL